MVWQKLEEQNPQFFQLYYVSIKLKDQIVAFNYLVGQQVRPKFEFHVPMVVVVSQHYFSPARSYVLWCWLVV